MSKISVFLDEETHRDAKIAAMDSTKSLSTWIADLVARQLSKSAAGPKRVRPARKKQIPQ